MESKKPKIKECKACSKEFSPYTSLDKFCSALCRINNMKSERKFNWSEEAVNRRKGANNPAYRAGSYVRSEDGRIKNELSHQQRLFMRNKKEITEAMIDQCGFVYCQHCKTSSSLKWETHHILFRSEVPKHENLHNPRNLIHLCVKCHNWFHSKKDRRNDLIVERKLWELFDHLPNEQGGSITL